MNTPGLHRVTAPLVRRLRSMIARCVLDAVDPDRLRQTLKVKLLDGEMAEGVEHFEPYGYTSHPLDGDGVFLSVGSSRAHGVIMNIGGKTYRLKGLKAGEVALYTDEGDSVILKRNHNIEINTHTCTVNASTKVEIATPLIHATGNIHADGDVVAGTVSLQGHIHPENDSGGPTDPPIA